MVREPVEAVAEQPLAVAQQGSWAGRTYTCTDDLGDGQLVLRVEVLRSRAGARARFRLDKADIAFTAATTVMTCWPGGEA